MKLSDNLFIENTKLFEKDSFDAGIPKLTGKFMFQFDDDEPTYIGAVYDYGKITIEIQQPKPSTNESFIGSNDPTSIIFTNNGKKFKIFIDKA